MSEMNQNTVQREKRKREESRGNMCVCVWGGSSEYHTSLPLCISPTRERRSADGRARADVLVCSCGKGPQRSRCIHASPAWGFESLECPQSAESTGSSVQISMLWGTQGKHIHVRANISTLLLEAIHQMECILCI